MGVLAVLTTIDEVGKMGFIGPIKSHKTVSKNIISCYKKGT